MVYWLQSGRVAMRAGFISFLAFAACTSNSAEAPESVRERLESTETELVIATAESTGSITAQRRGAGGWVAGSVELTVEHGQLVTRADARGSLKIERLSIDLGPIEIPESVLGYAAQLTDVHLEAMRPAGVVTSWSGDDEARATAEVELELTWSLTIDGETSPLGAPRLPAVPLELVLTGDGSVVRAEVNAAATGMFWSWADLIKLEDLNLFLAAATVSP